ncbi:putative C6 transcription factor [Aspergillus lucknowensis]|uniref:Zn(2)-C6 fungal-type domain-containing protein n=1 Tax=Aspergillus lucknowensis TaxID=176173 RepID=A0ABR4LE52_9EURO
MSNNASRRARAGACATCRTRKRRCIPTTRGEACQLCRSLSTPCSLNLDSGPLTLNKREVHVGVAEPGPLVSQEVCVELVHIYFRYIHDIPHTIFHEPSFLRRLNEGTAPTIHIYAMFSNNPVFDDTSPCDRGKVFAAEALRLCQQYMISPSLATVQAFLLVGYYFSGEGNIDGKHIYIGLARLHAERLSLSDNPSAVYQEEYRRSWLSIHVASHWSAWDMAMEPVSLPDRPDYLPKIDDATFRTASAELLDGTYVPDASRCDMWAQMARTLGTFAKINTLMRQLSRNMISFDDYYTHAVKLEAALNRWAANLPPRLTWGVDNLMVLAGQRLGQIYLAMHIGFFHFQQMLFFPFLDARATRNLRPDRAVKCKESAAAVSSILQYSMNIKHCELDYFIYGHIAVVSSCVHLHTLLFSEDYRELSVTRQRLVSNFQYLMTLKSYWPIVEHYSTHLRTFQNSCRDSMSDPFVLDNWMARFLTEHSSTLSERQRAPSQSAEPGAFTVAADRKSGSGNATPAPLPTSIEFLTASESGNDEAGDVWKELGHQDDLTRLLHNQDITGEALVNSALSWLLDGDDETNQTAPT